MKQFEETAGAITLHGLGFLQIKLSNNQRIHVWHPDLPKRKCFKYSSIHDHRFGFVSRVLIGTQINQFYRIIPKAGRGTHIAYLHEGKRSKYGNRPWIEDYRVTLERVGGLQIIRAGEEYSVNPYMYHSSECKGVCVTLMTKNSEHNIGAHSLCEIRVQPDVDFDRKQWPEAKLWKIFNLALSGKFAM